MKTKNFILLLTFFTTLQTLTGCRWDENALFGRAPRHETEDFFSSSSCTFAGRDALVKTSETGLPECASPALIDAVTAEERGVITIWLPRLADGGFATVSNLSFDRTQYPAVETIPFDCTAGRETPDGKRQEITCVPRSSWRLSAVNLASTDRRLSIRSLTLKNPACSKVVNLGRGWDNTTQIDCARRHTETTPYGELDIPTLWIEAGAGEDWSSGG